MNDQPQVNEAEARTTDGTLRDQSQPPLEPTTTTQQTGPTKTDITQTETSQTTGADTKTTEDTTKKEESKAAGAPEKYEAFKLPEGVELKGDTLASAQELFKGLGLTQEAAQSLVDFHTAQMTAAAAAPITAYNEMREGWKAATAADPELGPKAATIKENLGKAFDTLNNPKLVTDFKDAMNLTGVGDHPAFIKVMNTWAKQITEGRPVRAGGPSEHGQNDKGQQQRPTVAQGMYPNLKP